MLISAVYSRTSPRLHDWQHMREPLFRALKLSLIALDLGRKAFFQIKDCLDVMTIMNQRD
jgi:hypothetical protein